MMARFGTDEGEVFDDPREEEQQGADEPGLPDEKADHDD